MKSIFVILPPPLLLLVFAPLSASASVADPIVSISPPDGCWMAPGYKHTHICQQGTVITAIDPSSYQLTNDRHEFRYKNKNPPPLDEIFLCLNGQWKGPSSWYTAYPCGKVKK